MWQTADEQKLGRSSPRDFTWEGGGGGGVGEALTESRQKSGYFRQDVTLCAAPQMLQRALNTV